MSPLVMYSVNRTVYRNIGILFPESIQENSDTAFAQIIRSELKHSQI